MRPQNMLPAVVYYNAFVKSFMDANNRERSDSLLPIPPLPVVFKKIAEANKVFVGLNFDLK